MEHEDNLGDLAPTERGNETAGRVLLRAREKAGLTRADIASRTKIAERHLVAIEEDRLSDLAAPTYAVGFSRAYARTLGLDEADVAQRVRDQLEMDDTRHVPPPPSFEPGDPARIPSRALAWLGLLAVVVVIGVVLVFWGNFLSPESSLPDLTSDQPSQSAKPAAGAKLAIPQPKATGPVMITATQPSVWIKVVDEKGKQLIQKVMTTGDSWTVPKGTKGAVLRVGRANGIEISVDGRVLPPLSSQSVVMGNISLDPASLIARANGKPAPMPVGYDGALPPDARPLPGTRSSPSPVTTPATAPADAATRKPLPRKRAAATPQPRPEASGTTQAGTGVQMVSQPVVQPLPRAED